MDKKLTLSLNQGIIDNAKLYAKSNNISLSKLIEAYLSSLTRKTGVKSEITPLVQSISGVIEVPNDYNERKAYSEHVEEKYK